MEKLSEFSMVSVEKLSNEEIEEKALEWVERYLKNKGIASKRGERGVDIIAIEGSDEKYIEVKGCAKRETNLRIVLQALKYTEEHGKLKQDCFFIYYVYEIATNNPKLLIFDFNTYEKKKFEEKKILIQPFKIRRETGKPDIIELARAIGSGQSFGVSASICKQRSFPNSHNACLGANRV